MGDTVGIERVGKLRAVGAKPVAQQFLQLSVEAFDFLANLFLLGGAIGCGVNREATPAAPDARAERDKTRQPAFDRITRRWSVVEDGLGIRDNTLVIAIQDFQEQCILVAKGRIEARLGEAGGRGDVAGRSALESFSPEHVAREVQRLVGIETARSCHRTYVRADREIAKGGVEEPVARNLHQGLASTAAPPDGGVTGRRNRMRWYSQPIATSTRPRHMNDSAR